MLHGVVTLFVRSLRMEAHWLRTHLYRLVFAFMIYGMMLLAQLQSMTTGAPGLTFFAGMLFLNATFITLGGLAFFSTAITEEKEENTIGLLMMAGISPLSLLLGKSTSRLLQALILLLIQFPFTLLAITLGGVLLNQVLAAYASLLAFTVLFANVGLLASVVSQRTGTAMGYSTLFLILYTISPPLADSCADWLKSRLGWPTQLDGALDALTSVVANSSVWMRLSEIQQSTFADAPIGTQVITNVIGALVCFLLAWGVFPWFALSDDHGVTTRGWISIPAGRWKLFSAGRAWSNPLIWKEYNFLAGGHFFSLIKFVAYGLSFPLLGLLFVVFDSSGVSGPNWDDVLQSHVFLLLGILILELSIQASRIFHDEIRAQTMVSLLTLPRSIGYIGYSKLAGALLGIVPVAFWIGVDLLCIPQGVEHAVDAIGHPAFWMAILILTAYLHLTVLLSLFVRWGALPLSFFITLMSNYCCPLLWMPMIFLSGSNGEPEVTAILIGIQWVMLLITGFLFQVMIHARLYELGSK